MENAQNQKLTSHQKVAALWAEITANRENPYIINRGQTTTWTFSGEIGPDITMSGFLAQAKREVAGAMREFINEEVDLTLGGKFLARLGRKNGFNESDKTKKLVPTVISWVVTPQYDAFEGTDSKTKAGANQLHVFHGAEELPATVIDQIYHAVMQSKAKEADRNKNKLSKLNITLDQTPTKDLGR